MRHGRSERAGNLKAGNITPPLDWMTTSNRLTLPHGTRGLGLAWYVLKPLDLFGSTCKLEMRLTAGVSQLNGIVFDLELFDLLHELMVLHHGVGFSIGDGGEKSICNGAKEYSVDVVVGGEG